jgi:6-phospho-beta-glucosidase
MKITILGAAGVRTPIIVLSILHRQERLKLDELALMDIDEEHLELIGSLTDSLLKKEDPHFRIQRTSDAHAALLNADFVITTFRVGGIEQRMIDERIAIQEEVLGQETTGPAGFAMAMRSIPVLMSYLEMMKTDCPDAWLLNFANPSGMLAEAVLRKGGWEKAVGICDGPASMQRTAAELLGVRPEELYVDYFGLNHLGWIRSLLLRGKDILPEVIENIDQLPVEDLPFQHDLIQALGMIPNEYLYYYYSSRQAVARIVKAEKTRGEQIHELNEAFFKDLKALYQKSETNAMEDRYIEYQRNRWQTYMSIETGALRSVDFKKEDFQKLAEGGYSGVALDIIEALNGNSSRVLTLNVMNNGSVAGMPDDAVVEVPVVIGPHFLKPLTVGKVPAHCLGLMSQVKAYERLTIEAALEGSYKKALLALILHPLIQDEALALKLLEKLIKANPDFPKLQ